MTCAGRHPRTVGPIAAPAQEHARPVNPSRLSGVGPIDCLGDLCLSEGRDRRHPLLGRGMGRASGKNHTDRLRQPHAGDRPDPRSRDKRDIDAFGCGLHHTIATAPKDKHFRIRLNVITPYMPITSDGKAPNLEVVPRPDRQGRERARCGRRTSPTAPTARTQKSIVLDNLDDAIAKVSGDGRLQVQPAPALLRAPPHRPRRDSTRS